MVPTDSRPDFFIFVLCMFLFLAPPMFAEDLLVPSQFSSIQAAIEIAVDGDRVLIDAGTFSGQGFRGISFLGKTITVQGAGIDETIIDCQQMDRGFDFQYGETIDSVLRDLTVINGLDGCGT